MSTPNNPNDLIEKIMKIMLYIILTYFVIVYIPQVLIKLFQ